MANVTGASLTPILERLNAVDNYHPMNADTFADWATEAGDIVSVTRDGRTYNSPVHSLTMTWKGTTPQTTINATGRQKREPVSTVSNRKFRGGKSGIRKTGKQYKYEVNQDHLLYEIFDTEGRFSQLEVTEMGLFHEVYDTDGAVSRLQNTARGLYHEVYDADGKVSVLENTADGLYNEVYNPRTGLNARLQTQEDRVGMVVGHGQGKDFIKAGEIAIAINESTGESEALINANKIRLTGDTTVGGTMSVSGGIVSFNGNVQAGLTGNNYIRGTQLRIVGPSSSQGASELIVNYTALASTIKDASVSNNTLTLTKYDGTTVTFNKSVTLTPAWGGADGRTGKTYTVTATQNNVSVGSESIELADGEWAKTYDPGVAGTWSGNIFTGNIVQKTGSGHYGTTGLTYSVDATKIWNDGVEYGDSHVTVISVGLASNYKKLGDNETRYNIYIEGQASNGAKKSDCLLQLGSTTYDSNKKRCVNLYSGDDVIGRLNVDGIYEDGVDAGYEEGYGVGEAVGEAIGEAAGRASVHLKGTWSKSESTITNDNKLTIEKTTDGTLNSLVFVVSASASLKFNSSTHKYTATAQAKVDGANKGNAATQTSGEIKIDTGSWSGGSRTITVKEGSTALRTATVTWSLTVNGWSRTNFTSSTSEYSTSTGRTLDIPVSVKVNGSTYKNTFTTGGFRVVKRDSTHMYIYCGNTCIGLYSV